MLTTYEGEPQKSNGHDGFWKQFIRVADEENRQRASQTPPLDPKVYVFGDVSPSTASNLRREHGLDAYTITRDGVTEVHVRYLPDQVDRIKQDTKERGDKRKATMAANKAAKANKQTAKAK
jgi:hypothetical protein